MNRWKRTYRGPLVTVLVSIASAAGAVALGSLAAVMVGGDTSRATTAVTAALVLALIAAIPCWLRAGADETAAGEVTNWLVGAAWLSLPVYALLALTPGPVAVALSHRTPARSAALTSGIAWVVLLAVGYLYTAA